MSDTASRGATPGRVIKGIFALQIVIGLLLVAGDVSVGGWRAPSFGPDAPEMDQPVRPGDQTRRYRQRDTRDVPNRPFPPTPDMPPRLTLTDVEYEGAPALRLVGTIAPGDGARMADVLAQRIGGAETPPLVLLHSPGGSVTDALELGRVVRSLDLPVEIASGDVCLSACPYLFAGGRDRSVAEGGSVGVHQHYFGENTVLPAFLAVEDIQRGQGMVMTYLDEMGVDPLVMQHALVTPPDAIYILLPEELERYEMVTGTPSAG